MLLIELDETRSVFLPRPGVDTYLISSRLDYLLKNVDLIVTTEIESDTIVEESRLTLRKSDETGHWSYSIDNMDADLSKEAAKTLHMLTYLLNERIEQ